jgi:drug/metabolite transporter (DMT)-like permease
VTIGSLFGALGLFSMLIVIKDGPLQWLGVYSLAGIVFTTIYLLFFEEVQILKSLTGSTFIFLGFTIYLWKNKNSSQKIDIKQHLLLLVMTVFYSLSSVFHWKNLDANVPALFIIANQEIIVFTIAILISIYAKTGNEIYRGFHKNFKNVTFMATVIFFALLFSLKGLKETNPIISGLLFLSSPLMTILFGAIFFKEKLSISNALSIGIIAAGAFILHYQENQL